MNEERILLKEYKEHERRMLEIKKRLTLIQTEREKILRKYERRVCFKVAHEIQGKFPPEVLAYIASFLSGDPFTRIVRYLSECYKFNVYVRSENQVTKYTNGQYKYTLSFICGTYYYNVYYKQIYFFRNVNDIQDEKQRKFLQSVLSEASPK